MYDYINIDVDSLRKDLFDYFGTAMCIASPLAMMELSKIQNASDEEIIRMAIDNNVDLNLYVYKSRSR